MSAMEGSLRAPEKGGSHERARRRGGLLRPAVVAAALAVAAAAAVLVGLAAPLSALAASLPDGRAYEQVSPVRKHGYSAGAEVAQNTAEVAHADYAAASPGGDAVLYKTGGPMGETNRSLQLHSVSERTAAGWTTRAAISSPASQVIDLTGYQPGGLFPSDDMSRVLFRGLGSYAADNPVTNPATSAAMYISNHGAPTQWLSRPRTLNPVPEPGQIALPFRFLPAGASPSLDTAYFSYQGTLLPEDASREPNLESGTGAFGFYKFENGSLSAAGRLPDGGLDPFGAVAASTATSRGFGPSDSGNQVSVDGSRAFFLSPVPGTSSGRPTQLYLHRDGQSSVLVSRSELTGDPAAEGVGLAGPGGGLAAAVFASADGTRVFFRSTGRLTADAPVSTNLKSYVADLDDSGAVELHHVADATRVLATSADGSRMLLLHRTDTPDPFSPPTGTLRLLEGDSIRDVAALPPSCSGFCRDDVVSIAHATADGSAFVFATDSPLGSGLNNGGGHFQVYRYEPEGDTLTCMSCPPQGTAPSGSAHLQPLGRDQDGGQTGPFGQLRSFTPMSSGGARVFFDSPDALERGDTNGKRDVYEWTAGRGLALISSGQGRDDSFFLDSTPSGDDVFFATTEGLVGADDDGGYDVYDARVGGGFPPGKGVVPCTGSCQSEAPSPPPSADIGSSAFQAPGGKPAARDCAKLERRADRRARKAKKAKRGARQAHRKAKKAKHQARRLKRTARTASGRRADRLHKRTKRAREKQRHKHRKAKKAKHKKHKKHKKAQEAKRDAKRCKRGGK